MSNILHKSVLLAATASIIVSTLTAGVFSLASSQRVKAASNFDQTTCTPQNPRRVDAVSNIFFCGLHGTDSASYVQNLHDYIDYLNLHSDANGKAALAAELSAGGLDTTWLSDTSSSSWKIGTANTDNSIIVDNHNVGTITQIASRCLDYNSAKPDDNCRPPSEYHKMNSDPHSNAYLHNSSFLGITTPTTTLVHMNSAGQADFAMATPCGNMMKFTPTPVVITSLTCTSLTSSNTNGVDYTFTATASSQNTTVSSFTFDFGDSSQSDKVTVSNGTNTATVTHSYTKVDAEKVYTVIVRVNGTVTSDTCKQTVTIPGLPTPTPTPTASLSCVSLDAKASSDNKTFTFTATTQSSNTTIASYIFDFGDSTILTQSGNVATHTYADTGVKNVKFTAKTAEGLTTTDSSACKTTASPAATLAATQLVVTGPAEIFGVFAFTAAAGIGLHQFMLRRKLNA